MNRPLPLTPAQAASRPARPASRVLTQFAIVVFAVLGAGLVLGKLAVDAVIAQVEREELNDSVTRTKLAFERRGRRSRRMVANLASNVRTLQLLNGPLTPERAATFSRDFFESPPPLDFDFVVLLNRRGDEVYRWSLPGSVAAPRLGLLREALPLARRVGGAGSQYLRDRDTVFLIGVASVPPLADDTSETPHVIIGRAMAGPAFDEMQRDLRLDVRLLRPETELPPTPMHSEPIAGGDSVRAFIELLSTGHDRAAVIEMHDTRTGLRDISQWTFLGAVALFLFGTLSVFLVWRYGSRLLLTPLRAIALEIVGMHARGELTAIASPPPSAEWALFVATFNDTVRSLHDTEQRYRALFDKSIDPFFLVDSGSDAVVDANPAAAALTGTARAALVGLPLPESIRATPPKRTVRLTRADGVSQTWGVVETPVQFAGRQMRLVAYRDLTDREALAQSQKMQAIGSLAGGIAHDFNNLMGSVLAGVRVARDAGPTERRAVAALDAIEHAGQRAAELTRQLLGLSARESIVRVPVDVAASIANIQRMCVSTFDRRVRIEVDVPARLPAIDGDPGQLEQALLNLAINARDAMPEGGTLRLSARAEIIDATRAFGIRDLQPGRYVVVSVQDEGSGMPDDVKSRIFEPFFTTKGPGKGTGLGLAMVYGLLQNSGGTVTVESAPGAGSRFDLYFPVSASGAALRTPPPIASVAPRPADPRAERPRVLLVDDEAGLREMLRMVLESEGYDVVEAENGAEAVAIVERDAAHLQVALIDVQMPVMGGVEAFTRLRAIVPHLPVILGTGFAGEAELGTIRTLGADDLLTKPYDIRLLLDRLAQLTSATR